jgi:uncharacterized metal-binding protein
MQSQLRETEGKARGKNTKTRTRVSALRTVVDFPLGRGHRLNYGFAMPTSADALRRWLGLCFLTLAFGLLVWGRTVLQNRLSGIPFLIYWVVCFLLTMAAIITALLDLRATRKRARQEHEELLQRTLNELEDESHDKPGK